MSAISSSFHQLFLTQDGRPISPTTFHHILYKVSIAANLSHLHITPHSFRIGAAMTADVIQRMGCWSSHAFLHYIRLQVVHLTSHS